MTDLARMLTCSSVETSLQNTSIILDSGVAIFQNIAKDISVSLEILNEKNHALGIG